MNQGNSNEMNRTAANQEQGSLVPMVRPFPSGVRPSEALTQHAALPGSSALSVPAVSHLENMLSGKHAPVWLAALVAASCRAQSQGTYHEIRWRAVSRPRRLYQFRPCTERIEPLGVDLPAGDTVAVWWEHGDTAYAMEVYSDSEKCA